MVSEKWTSQTAILWCRHPGMKCRRCLTVTSSPGKHYRGGDRVRRGWGGVGNLRVQIDQQMFHFRGFFQVGAQINKWGTVVVFPECPWPWRRVVVTHIVVVIITIIIGEVVVVGDDRLNTGAGGRYNACMCSSVHRFIRNHFWITERVTIILVKTLVIKLIMFITSH